MKSDWSQALMFLRISLRSLSATAFTSMRDWPRHVIEITAAGRFGVATLVRRTMGNESRA
jgi:hypothetical protein